MDSARLVRSGSDANLPPLCDAATAVYGSGLGIVHSSAKLRAGVSACSMSEWYSDTSLACKVSSGFPGQNMGLVVTVDDVQSTLSSAISYDSPKLLAVGEQLPQPHQSTVFLHGTNLGSSDYSLRATIGVYGCKLTVWVSDTSLQCSLNPGFTSTDVTVQALKQSASCLTCLPHETLVRCTPSHPGICVECAPCSAGFFRDCYAGPASSGQCEPCPNENLPHEHRYFKAVVGTNKTACTRCKVCKQNEEYQKQRCTTTVDTLCDACEPCASGVRVGCGGESAGRCEVISADVFSVLDSASGVVKGSKISDSRLVLSEPFELWMTGPNNGTGLRIPERTVLDFPNLIQDISLSAVSPTQKMLDALQDRALLQERSLARFGNNNTRRIFKMISPVIYCSPSGLSMSQSASVFFEIDMDPIFANPSILYLGEPIAAAAYFWNTVNEKWELRSEVIFPRNDSFEFRTQTFSSYVILAPFNESFEDGPDWWLVKSLRMSREQWALFIFLPACILLCCCIRFCYFYTCKRKHAPKSSIENKPGSEDKVKSATVIRRGATMRGQALGLDKDRLEGGHDDSGFDALAYSGVITQKDTESSPGTHQHPPRSALEHTALAEDPPQPDDARGQLSTDTLSNLMRGQGMPKNPTKLVMKSASGPVLLDVNAVDPDDGTVFLSPVRNVSVFEYPDRTRLPRSMSPLEHPDKTHFRNVSLRRSIVRLDSGARQAGVGIALDLMDDGNHVVTDLNDQGPAAESGQIGIGDKLISVDGVPVRGLSREEVSNMFLGPSGSLIQLVVDADAIWTSHQMADLAIPLAQIQPEPVRRQAALPSLRQRPGYDVQSAPKEKWASTPKAITITRSDAGVRRRADLDEVEIGNRHRESGIHLPTLLGGAQTISGGRQGTAGSKSRFEKSNLDSAFELLERTLKDHNTRQKGLEEDRRVEHMLNVRSEMLRSRGEPFSPSKVEPSASSTVSVTSMATRSSETLGSLGAPSQGFGTPYSRQAGIVAPTGKQTKPSQLPSLQFSRRSMPTTVPDVEVPLVFSPPSGRMSEAPAQAVSGFAAPGNERRLAAATTASALKSGRNATPRSHAGDTDDKADKSYQGWASDW